MNKLQKDILKVILESQLMIEKKRLKAINSRPYPNVGEWNICRSVINEIARQLKLLTELL